MGRLYFTISMLVLIVFCIGCGSGGNNGSNTNGNNSTTNNPPPPTYQDVTGNWQITAKSNIQTGTVWIGTVLQGSTSSPNVSGIAHIYSSSCFDYTIDIPVTGTIDTTGDVKIATATTAGQVVTATLKTTGQNTMTGTYTVAGGCAGGDNGNLTGAIIPNVSGTWTGSVQSNTDNSVSQVSAQLTQATTANSDGLFPLTGTIAFPNGTCFSSGSLFNSTTSGGFLTIFGQTGNGVFVSAAVVMDATTAKNMIVAYQIVGGVCDGDSGQGTMSRP